MKIAVIGSRDYHKVSGGIEKHVKMLYEAMIDISDSVKVDIFFPTSQINTINKCSTDTINNNLSFIYINLITSINLFEKLIYCFKCLPLIIKNKYDVVHFHGMNSVWIIPFVLFFTKSKIITTQHSLDHLNFGVTFYKRIISFISSKILLLSHEIFCVSDYVFECVGKGVVINNGFDPSFNKMKFDFVKYGLKKNEYLCFVGRITKEKGIDMLINSYVKSSLTIPLVIVGGSNSSHFFNYILDLIEKTDKKIIYVGEKSYEDTLNFIKNSLTLISPSFSEGFGLVVLESLFFKKTPLLSNIPAHRNFNIDSRFYFNLNEDNLIKLLNNYMILKDYYKCKYVFNSKSWKQTSEEVFLNYKRTLSE